jgi:resuscitation-promoting factor RpfB
VPDRGLDLSPLRTLTAKSVRSAAIATGSALALSAVVLGSVATPSPALTAAAATRPTVQLVSAVTPAARQAVSLTPRQIARRMFGAFHWRPRRQFRFLNMLWDRESGWNVHAQNPWSGAYGIPQAVPGGKMASAGPDWQNSARTQILWGLRYIAAVYGKPRIAWIHEVEDGWY